MKTLGMLVCTALLTLPASAIAKDDLGCNDVNFSADVAAQLPNIRAACQSISMREDKVYAKFKAEVVKADKDSLTVRFKDRDNKDLSEVVFAHPADAKLKIEGRDTKYSDLQKGQTLDLWVQHSKWGLYADPADLEPLTLNVLSRKQLASR